MKKTTKIVVAVILVIIIAVIYVLFFNKAEAPENTNVSTATSTSWKTYTLKNVTVKAPADLTIQIESLLSGTGAKVLIPMVPPYFRTHLIGEAYININKPSKTCSESGDEVVSRKQITSNNIKFTRTEWDGVGAGNIYQGIDYSTTINGLCYQATLFTHGTNGEGFYTDNAEQIKRVDAQQAMDIKNIFALFDKIMATVALVK